VELRPPIDFYDKVTIFNIGGLDRQPEGLIKCKSLGIIVTKSGVQKSHFLQSSYVFLYFKFSEVFSNTKATGTVIMKQYIE
jgi:hypothetical protein